MICGEVDKTAFQNDSNNLPYSTVSRTIPLILPLLMSEPLAFISKNKEFRPQPV